MPKKINKQPKKNSKNSQINRKKTNNKIKISFYGAAKEVEGSRFLVEYKNEKVLIDCGIYRDIRNERNYEPLPFDPKELKAVILTHAHIDHSGLAPLLYKNGFRGKIYATPPTIDCCSILWEDAFNLMKEAAEKQGLPLLYDENDMQETLKLFSPQKYYQEVKISPRISFIFYNAGHILGSAIVLLKIKKPEKEVKILFSGDLGNSFNILLPDTDVISEEADYCIVESTYGNKIHEDAEIRKDLLEDAIEEVIRNRGVLMIPVLALERTQEILVELNELVVHHRVPLVPIFMDSPLAGKLTAVYQKYLEYIKIEAFKFVGNGRGLFEFPGLTFTLTTEESKAINAVPPPKVILAGSGSSEGGRILHHEKRYLSDPHSILLIVSYQAKNSLGRKILEGAKQVEIHNELINVNCKVMQITGYSAHADQRMLLDWIKELRFRLKKLFVVHGEEEASKELAQKVKDNFGVVTEIPDCGQTFELE
ncbi:MAG: MBL fold metallo-hydrolase RNA specificity domain-containing protein [Minisyncoccia bacterium]